MGHVKSRMKSAFVSRLPGPANAGRFLRSDAAEPLPMVCRRLETPKRGVHPAVIRGFDGPYTDNQPAPAFLPYFNAAGDHEKSVPVLVK